MIIKRVYTTIWCEQPDCTASLEVEEPVYVALRMAAEAGWTRRARGGPIKEFCPDHRLVVS